MVFSFWQNATDNQRFRCSEGGDGLKGVFSLRLTAILLLTLMLTFTPTLEILDLAKCHGHPVCLRRWEVRMAWTAGKTGRGMRPWPWAPRTLYKASCRGGGDLIQGPTLYAAQYARPWVGRTDAEREERGLGV